MKRWICAALSATLLLLVPLSGFGASGDRIDGYPGSGAFHVERYYLVDGHADQGTDTAHTTIDLEGNRLGYPRFIWVSVTKATGCSAAYTTYLQMQTISTSANWHTLATVSSTTKASPVTYPPMRYLRGFVLAASDTGCTDLDVVVTMYFERTAR